MVPAAPAMRAGCCGHRVQVCQPALRRPCWLGLGWWPPVELTALLPLGPRPPTLERSGPRGCRCLLPMVPGRLFTQLSGGVGLLPLNSGLRWLGGSDPDIWICVLLSCAREQLESWCLHCHYSLPARLSWGESRSPPVPLAAAAAFLQCPPSRESRAIPNAGVPRLASALACVVPPAHRSCSGGGRG